MEKTPYYLHNLTLEGKVGKYLDNTYYAQAAFESRRNTTNREAQLHGVDVVCKEGAGKYMFVDEKAAVTAYDYDLPTFAIELKNNNEPGWFKFKGEEYSWTTHYLFVYPHATDRTLTHMTGCECILVEKKLLKDYLLDNGINEMFVENWQNYPKEYDGRSRPYLMRGDVKVIQSTQLPQQPINALVKRTALRALAKDVWTTDEEEVIC